MVQTTQDWGGTYSLCVARNLRGWIGDLLLQPLVRTVAVEVRYILFKDAPQVRLAQDE